ncbi:MAG TPA: c-type cytochrome [Longimicrobiales bacterium]|nr:c-type cytochrome [Longimicrobiales bacterium]
MQEARAARADQSSVPTGRIRRARVAGAIALLMTAAACEKHEFEPPSREAQVAQADSIYSPALFDTIAWESDSLRLAVGNDIFAARCRRCHGYLGQGGPVEVRGDTVDVPSLVAPDWSYTGDVDAIRRRIFTGHPAGMPIWGIAGLAMREIDAVAWYIDAVLRQDVEG